MILFGTAGIDKDGQHYLSDYADHRINRTAEIYNSPCFDRETGKILIVGGYSKGLVSPPEILESRLMGRRLIEICDIPEDSILYEIRSTDTWENFYNSLEQYPWFYEKAIKGQEKIGLISHPFHVKRAIRIGSVVLDCFSEWYLALPTPELDNQHNEEIAMQKVEQRINALRKRID